MTFDLVFDIPVEFKVKGRGTGYRPEIMLAGVPKWSQTIASLPETPTQP